MTDVQFNKLPVWAKHEISEMKRQHKNMAEYLSEIEGLKSTLATMRRRNDAIEELLFYASKGGHKTAQEIIEVLESYSLTVTKYK